MRKSFYMIGCAGILLTFNLAIAVTAADNYKLDPMHAAVTFKIAHLGLSWTHGRFNDVSGEFTIDTADPTKSSFTLAVKSESVDTGVSKRDDHLRGPDFFNVKQFPVISFKSTAVKPAAGGFEVTGDLTMHGVTRPVTFTVAGGRTAQFPPGTVRTGYSTQLKLKRSEFGMKEMLGMVGDDIYISISFEGVKS
jgi:polyisoprenoid-binding protein YceI